MKVEELRINNLVYVPETKQETNITAIYNHIGVIVNSSLVWLNISDVEAIPLTEEWLIKFGFEKVVKSFFIGGFEIYNDYGLYFYGLRDEGLMDRNMKYVNQLQNLYFSLTGEELTIKTENK